jgi:pSer/pThr/pTyr-binding forkhead associated (FHA) protein
MPVLQLDDQQFPLKPGATRIGAGAGADVIVPGYSTIAVEAVIDGGATPTIRRAEEGAHVRVNGVLLGAEPTPLMHGDKIEVAGLELQYADDSKSGATQYVSASEIAAIVGAKRTGAARATAASGGRVVSLVDGKEYAVADSGLVFGRDASCGVVVAQNEVSRRHAEIVVGDEGYVLRDTSANGLYVNAERVQGSHKLARADVLRIGSEEFRFYADVLAATPVAAPKPSALVAAPAAPPTVPAKPPAAQAPNAGLMDVDLLPVMAAMPVAVPAPVAPAAPPVAAAPQVPTAAPASPPPPASPSAVRDPRPVVAILESRNEGPEKGTKYELRTPLGHVGRGAHNDVHLSDESVSETHAKLQKREDGWYVVDMDSTNGTYVGGTRVNGERKIEGSPDVRFGGMKFRFTAVGPSSAAEAEAKGTRAISAIGRPPAMAAEQPTAKTPIPGGSSAAPESDKSGGGVPAWVWIVAGLVVVAAGVAFFVLRGRA